LSQWKWSRSNLLIECVTLHFRDERSLQVYFSCIRLGFLILRIVLRFLYGTDPRSWLHYCALTLNDCPTPKHLPWSRYIYFSLFGYRLPVSFTTTGESDCWTTTLKPVIPKRRRCDPPITTIWFQYSFYHLWKKVYLMHCQYHDVGELTCHFRDGSSGICILTSTRVIKVYRSLPGFFAEYSIGSLFNCRDNLSLLVGGPGGLEFCRGSHTAAGCTSKLSRNVWKELITENPLAWIICLHNT